MLTLVRANGEESQDLPSDFEIQIGDRLTLLSGGGGGFGRAEN
jgi:N-methylhydantoinase B/oxoprolinase/acetone carboxylase alpha subunit